MSCKILACKCQHEYQDLHYGQGKRVMNQTRKDSSGNGYRCTVCGALVNSGGDSKKDKEKK